MMLQSLSSLRKHGLLRRVSLVGMFAVIPVLACKRVRHADGAITRNWMPTQQDTYLGVPAAAVRE
ncbi:MAG TPA: hypothetical protein VGP84_15305, partial [Gemmatimonadaceae bacterium]|nr:hypothetical protein [Gemmatimonadaceae bacterium]